MVLGIYGPIRGGIVSRRATLVTGCINMDEFSSDEILIEKLVRSRRKTVELTITPRATLVVHAPLRTSYKYIRDIVDQKRSWIIRKLNEARERVKPWPRRFVNGEFFFYLGKPYELRYTKLRGKVIELSDKLYISERYLPRAKDVVESWYRAEALAIISKRCALYARICGYTPRAIKISNARKRWGSCSPCAKLNFSWRIVMAPLDIIDYLVAHELSHIGHHDHSNLFWHEVERIIPDFKRRRKWLRDNGHLLNF